MSFQIGFFRQFKGADSVLLAGAAEDLVDFLGRLERFVLSAERSLAIHDFASVSQHHPAKLFAVRSSDSVFDHEPEVFYWHCSPKAVVGIKQSIGALLSVGSGHQYFELFRSHVSLMISVGEYGSELWRNID